MGTPKKNNSRLWLLAALLFVLAIVLYFQRPWSLNTPAPAEIDTGRKAIPADANAQYAFNAYPGSVRIERDLQSVSLSGNDHTMLDGMDYEQLRAFRLEKVATYQKLGFFRPGYSPFAPPHNRIYHTITPGADWLYSVPYYIANPYLLVILVPANHVTPLDVYLPEVDIRYDNGTLSEDIRGASARAWFKAVYASDRSGIIRLVMVNAWDAGFRFIHLDPNLSSNIKLSGNLNNVTRSWHSQHCIFHVGRYKKNNLSPEDRRAWVELQQRDEPTRFHIKLWRSRPAGVRDQADLIFVIRIDPRLA